MGKALFNRTSGICEAWLRHDSPECNPRTHVVVEMEESPDKRAVRWEDGIREATALELAEYDAAKARPLEDLAQEIAALDEADKGRLLCFGLALLCRHDERLLDKMRQFRGS